MKKSLSLLLAAFLLASMVSCLFSCALVDRSLTEETEHEGITPPTTVPEHQVEDLPKRLSLVEYGLSDYVVVLPDRPSDAVAIAAEKLCDGIYALTGVRIPKWLDVRAKEQQNRSVKYILLGKTCFEESAQLQDELSATSEAYAIDCFGDTVVIASHYDGALIDAVERYLAECTEGNYDTMSNTLYFEGCYFDGETVFPSSFSLKNIADYAIVYTSKLEGFEEIAEMYRDAFERLTGVTLAIYRDTEKPEGPCEILLGYTNRSGFEAYYADSSRVMRYEVIVDKSSLLIAAGGPYSAKKCLYDMEANLFPFIGQTLAKGSYLSVDLAPVAPALTDGAELRLMSSNILAQAAASDNVLPVSQRLEIYCGVLLRYLPDAVGVQEADAPWSAQFPNYLEWIAKLDKVEYTYLLGTHNGRAQWEPILYRSDKYRCDYAEYTPAPYWTDTTRYLRGVSRANFTSLTDETLQFAIVNAHWNHTSSDKMYSDATQMVMFAREIMQKFPQTAVFCTGDFNSHYFESKPLEQLLTSLYGSIASELAKNNGTLQVPCGCRCHGGHGGMAEGVERPYDDDFIDHVIGVGSFEVFRHDTIIKNCTNLMTDHSAIYADIKRG